MISIKELKRLEDKIKRSKYIYMYRDELGACRVYHISDIEKYTVMHEDDWQAYRDEIMSARGIVNQYYRNRNPNKNHEGHIEKLILQKLRHVVETGEFI